MLYRGKPKRNVQHSIPMAIRPILIYPDSRLRAHAQPVGDPDSTVRALIDDLLDTMYAADGLGLAATQIGEKNRIFVMDLSDSRKQPQVMVNPVILSKIGRQKRQEGCLSIPGAPGIARDGSGLLRLTTAFGSVWLGQYTHHVVRLE